MSGAPWIGPDLDPLPRLDYPTPPVQFTWPTPGVRTWEPSNGGRYVFPGCSDTADCQCACSVGVGKVSGRVYGCDCPGHEERRAQLTGRPKLKPKQGKR
ncbi:hypothetical protein ABH932_000583 [Streptacidiphilus sp. MAP5-52]